MRPVVGNATNVNVVDFRLTVVAVVVASVVLRGNVCIVGIVGVAASVVLVFNVTVDACCFQRF